MLGDKNQDLKDAEKYWDLRSVDFGGREHVSVDEKEDFIFKAIKYKEILDKNKTVLDIGCGIGRHALGFSQISKSYTGIDISQGMLDRGLKSKNELKLENVSYKKCTIYDIEKTYDFVFASMCPGINSIESLDKINSISTDHCMIHRFFERDMVMDIIYGSEKNRPHGNSDYIYALSNILWDQGYFPQIIINSIDEEINKSVDEILESQGSKFLLKSKHDQEEVRDRLLSISDKGIINYKKTINRAIVFWDVNNRDGRA